MSKDLTSKQLVELKKEICKYAETTGNDLTVLFRRYKQGYYSHVYFKSRVNNSIYHAIRKEYGQESAKGVSHAGYAYPQVNEVLRDMYDYKQYKLRNENENKNEDITTGI